MKKYKMLIILSFAFLLLAPIGALAFTVKAANSIYVDKGETVAGNLYAAGANITIEGRIAGDLICAGQSINVNGKVDGDIICIGQSINVNGEVGGSIRTAGNSVNLNNKTARNLMAAGASVVLSNNAQVGWDMLVGGASVDILGKVSGDLTGAGANFNLTGEIGKNVRLKIDDRAKSADKKSVFKDSGGLKIGSSTIINGDLTYTGNKDAQIDANAKIKGEIMHKLPKQYAGKDRNEARIWGSIVSFFSALVVGLVLVSIGRKPVEEITESMRQKFWPAMGWGAIKLFLAPIALLLLFITIIGIPLSLILFGLWLIAIYISKILSGILIGRILIAKLQPAKKDLSVWAMILGILILYILIFLPVFGWFIGLLAVIYGLGGFVLYCRNACRKT